MASSLTRIFPDTDPSDEQIILWYKAYHDASKLFSKNEQELFRQRKITSKEKEKIINEKILSLKESFNNDELNLAKMYGLLTSGYQYEDKIIYKDASPEIINKIIDNNIPGISIETSFKRYYPYGNTLKDILGSTGNITKENKENYLAMGYNLNDEVGVSYLEKEYDSYLRGTKAEYLVNPDNSL